MSLYTPESGSLGVDETSGTPLNQAPIAFHKAVRIATLPDAAKAQARPDHVMINNSGSYAFLYTTTSSIGGTCGTAESWVTGSVTSAPSGLPVKLDINPIAWRDTIATTTGDTGDVTFVYNAKPLKKSV